MFAWCFNYFRVIRIRYVLLIIFLVKFIIVNPVVVFFSFSGADQFNLINWLIIGKDERGWF